MKQRSQEDNRSAWHHSSLPADNVVEEFVWSCNSRAPGQSAAWIQGVSYPQQQHRLFQRMLGEWAQHDAAAVKQWVAANTVPDDIRKRFLRRLQRTLTVGACGCYLEPETKTAAPSMICREPL